MKPVTRQRLLCIVSDYLMLNIGWLLFNVVRYHSLPLGWLNSAADFMLMPPVLLGQLLVPLLAVGLYAMSGYYNAPFDRSRVDDALNTAGVSALAALMIFFAVLINDDIPERLLNYQLLLILWLLLAAPVYACRYVLTAGVKRRVSNGSLRFGTLIVGTGPKAFDLEERIRRVPTAMGFDILAGDDTDPRHVAALIGRFVPLGCRVYMMPDVYSMLTARPRVRSVANVPLIDITAAGMSAGPAHMKRAGDLVVSAIALVALLPVYAAIALAVSMDSRGPVFYSQERVGYRNRRFRIYKFRTMRPDAEAAGPQLSSDGDPRITRVGAVLRKYRLDELPQFWNVLLGQMSLVGPRPEREHYERLIAERAPYVALLHQVRPGLTSWGMVKFGYAGSVDEMVERLAYDLLYIENVSLGVDLRIMLHTINTVLTGKGV